MKEELEQIKELAQKVLPPKYQDTLFLREWHDFSYTEIAEIQKIPLGTVMSRLHRGRKLMQEKYRPF